MTELDRIKAELEELLESLNTEHVELEKVKNEISQWRSEKTATMNNIVGLSKKIRTLQRELEDYLEE